LVKGSIIAGRNDTSTSTAVSCGALLALSSSTTILGDVVGNVGAGGKVNLATVESGGVGPASSLGKIDIRGSVTRAQIVNGVFEAGGYKESMSFADPLIALTIGGDFTDSHVSAGVGKGPDGLFGTSDDACAIPQAGANFAKIASIVIKGRASNPGGDASIQAQQIGKLTVQGVDIPLTKGKSNDDRLVPGTTIRVRELTGAPE